MVVDGVKQVIMLWDWENVCGFVASRRFVAG
jgi:hypothetical protein